MYLATCTRLWPLQLVALALLAAAVAASDPQQTPPSPGLRSLQFRSDGTFKIVQFSDLHYGKSKKEDDASDQASWLCWRMVWCGAERLPPTAHDLLLSAWQCWLRLKA